jgi:subtilisin-like proprotein convertase family protein
MRFESRTWFILSLLLFAAAIYFWMRGEEYQARKAKALPRLHQKTNTNTSGASTGALAGPFRLLSRIDSQQTGQSGHGAIGAGFNSHPAAPAPTNAASRAFPHRLANTGESLKQLTRSDSAILMRNALIDTAQGTNLAIPPQLRAQGDPGSYIVQARGTIQQGFRDRLKEAGATVVSYIPNNAYLVQLSSAGAQQLAGQAETQAVLPYEPYYKLDTKLLALAVEQKPLGNDQLLRVTGFPGGRDALATGVTGLGGEVVAEERTPFGPQLLVRPAVASLPAIAQLASVQIVELYHARALLNDQMREILGISTDGSTSANYLGLTGTNVLVNLNDSGVDATHPDLQGRVLGDTPTALTDLDGHGTHVAGTLAGNGSQSKSVTQTPPGSEPNPDFRGMAPGVQLFVVPFQASPLVSDRLEDSYLLQTAARTNALLSKRKSGPMISNNSWGAPGANEYDSSSARFDAGVRDADPETTGPQQMIFVFAAGNSGNGTDSGVGGDADTIVSPANAKNVITVGALEQLRNITNSIITTNDDGTFGTNATFLGMTDSIDEVAAFSSRGNVGIGIEGDSGRFKPDLVVPGTFIISTRSKDWQLENQIDTNTPQYEILKDVNEPLAPHYRYESGTSQAAPAVSGLLALMQEFFEQRLPSSLRRTNSPALMKALLINGARSAGSLYDFEVENPINYQGWGLPNITNTLPALMLTQPESRWPVRMFDQNPTNALGTGQSRSWNVVLSTNAQDTPLRVTLVWTDPPGNPGAAIKLVNDLDLVVSNTVSGEVYYGNNIGTGSDFTQPSALDQPAVSDVVNNVENVFVGQPGSSNFVVTVAARRVNVNAVTDYNQVTSQMNDVVQDFALVIATADPTITNAITVTPLTPPVPPAVTATPMTNGVPLLNQRVGANAALSDLKNGITNQWKFYVFTNVFMTNGLSTMTNGTNVAFVTFLPPDVSMPRNDSADIDLYVSKDPRLLQLDPSTIDTAFKSLSRGGTESIVFTNAAIGDIFYVGVKSEDQQGGEFGLIGLSSDQPFEENRNGKSVLNGMPVPQNIPDGTPAVPGRATVIAVGLSPTTAERVEVTDVLTHQDVGDLSVILTHQQASVVLHNHTLNNGFPNVTNLAFFYDDQGAPNARHSDGPGSLRNFVGTQINGVWLLNIIDSAPTQTGRVQNVSIAITPFQNGNLVTAGPAGLDGSVAPGEDACYDIDVPPAATNMVVSVTQVTGPLEAYLSHASAPTTNSFDKFALINPPGGEISLGANDEPVPLQAGRSFVCLHNSGNTLVTFHIAVRFDLGQLADYQRTVVSTNAVTVTDDGLITSTVHVPIDKAVADVQVAVRIANPRAADLVLHLISPQGTRVLLGENRGGSGTKGYGAGTDTNTSFTIFTEDTNLVKDLAPIKFALPPWTNSTGSTSPPTFFDGFENATPGIYQTNQTASGWTVTQGQAIVHTLGDPLGVAPQSGTNYLELDTTNTPASIATTFGTVPGNQYQLTFYYQRNPSASPGDPHAVSVYYGPSGDLRPPLKFIDVPPGGWLSTDIVFTASSALTELEFGAITAAGPLLDSVKVTDYVNATNVYVMPEESLSVLQGQRAMGDWTLEVLDTRRGPGVGGGVLLGWQLQLQYSSPIGRAITVTNGSTFSGVLSTNQTNFFVVDVCKSAKVAFATLTGALTNLNLLVSREGFPTGDATLDDFQPIQNDLAVDPNTGIAALILDSNPHQPAPLVPGGQLFFAVHNLDPTTTNTYDFQVTFDNDTCSGPRPVIRLENGVPYTNIVAPSRDIIDYYVFTVSPTAVSAQFDVTPTNGDVGLVLRYGLPLPDLNSYDYRQDAPGITEELIVLTNTSLPVPLTPGDWYAGVYNNSTNPVIYNITASEILDTNINVILLTNAIPLTFTIPQGAGLTNFFMFKVLDPYPGVRFELYDVNTNASLLVGYNLLPNAQAYFASNSASPTQPLTMEIRTNATLPQVTGNWVLEVIPQEPTNLTFTIRASVLQTNVLPSTNRVFDPDITVTSTNLCLSWAATVGLQYRVEAIKTVTDTNWTTIFGPTTATNTTMGYCINLPSPYSFFRVVEIGSGSVTPPPPQNIITPSLTVTTNSLCLSWPSAVGSTYQVQAKRTIVDTAWTNISEVITATNTTTTFCVSRPTPYSFFQVIENPGGSTTPPPPQNIITPSLTVTTNSLCLSWPSTVGSTYQVQAKRTIVDAAWTNISDVITATNTTTTFCVSRPTPYSFFQVIENPGGSTTPPPTGSTFIDPTLTFGTNGLCLTWPSQAGVQYNVQGKLTITMPWTNLVTLMATGPSTTHCLPRNTPYAFFQVATITAAGPPATGGATNGVTLEDPIILADGRLQLRWDADVGATYKVETTTNLVPVIQWSVLTNIVAASSPVTFTDTARVTDGPMRFYRVLKE